MSDERIFSNGASSLDVRSCEGCGEAAHIDDLRRCAGCECWSHDACSPDACEDENGEWYCTKDCLPKTRESICADMGILSDSERTSPSHL